MRAGSTRVREWRHLFQGGWVDCPLRSRKARLLLVLAVGIPAVALALPVIRIARAARFASRLDIQDLQRAIALDPGHAAYDHQLGVLYAYSLDPASLHQAVHFLQKAAELNPREAVYWSDLAEVCDTMNDTACSNPAVERALRLSPATPRLEWRAANHFLQTGHTPEALEHFRRLLALDGAYAQPVFQICLSATGDPQTVFQKVLPTNARSPLQLAYLDAVSAQGNIDFANQIWDRISSTGLSCKFEDVKPYLERLLSSDNVPQAARVWRKLEQAGVIPKSSEDGAENMVYNGEFGHAPLGAGFDWRAPNTPYVETDFRDPSGYRGSSCLRVDYAAGRNLESEPVYEWVPVRPGQSYRLWAYVRSDNITSDSGPRLRVLDPDCPACLTASTPATVGTTPWHPVSLDFTAGVRTEAVRLSVWRSRSWTFPMEISGSFWLDNVTITLVHSMPEEAASTR